MENNTLNTISNEQLLGNFSEIHPVDANLLKLYNQAVIDSTPTQEQLKFIATKVPLDNLNRETISTTDLINELRVLFNKMEPLITKHSMYMENTVSAVEISKLNYNELSNAYKSTPDTELPKPPRPREEVINEHIYNGNLTNPIIIKLIELKKDSIDWDRFSSEKPYRVFPPAFIRKFKDYINWSLFLKRTCLTNDIFEEFYNYFDPHEFWTHVNLNTILMNNLGHKIIWNDVMRNKSFTENLIQKYPEMIDWTILSERIDFSESFIKENLDKLNYTEEQLETILYKPESNKHDRPIVNCKIPIENELSLFMFPTRINTSADL